MNKRVDSVTNPGVKRLVKWRKPRDRRAAGVVLVEGVRELERAAAWTELREVWYCPELLGGAWISEGLSALPGDFERVEVSAAVMRKIAVMREPQGVVGVVTEPGWGWSDVPGAGDASDAGSLKEGRARRVLVAVETEKPGNLGAMVRTAEAAGFDAVVAAGGGVDVFNPSGVRNSTGAVFSTPVIVEPNGEAAVRELTSRGYVLAAAVAEGGTALHDVVWPRSCAVVIGPEHAGLSQAWRDAAALQVTIPMAGRVVDSLNASVAAGVMCFAAAKGLMPGEALT